MKKHAYLIMAHANPFVLEKLLLLIDDERNDIYMHIDKKTADFNFSYFQNLVQKSKLIFTKRIDVRWGHVSQIETELLLFRTAFEGGEYAYFHLVSGADLPIKSQDEIHQFFQEHNGNEFIGFSDDVLDEDKIKKIHLFPKNMRVNADQPLKRLERKLRMLFLSLQGSIGYNYASKIKAKFVQGANWASLTHNLVCDLLKQEAWFLRFYRYSSCGDEIYKHTFVYNSGYKDAVYNMEDEMASCSRFMDWKRGCPYTFREEDFEMIISSDMLFARKFEDAVDKEIADKIYRQIKGQ